MIGPFQQCRVQEETIPQVARVWGGSKRSITRGRGGGGGGDGGGGALQNLVFVTRSIDAPSLFIPTTKSINYSKNLL